MTKKHFITLADAIKEHNSADDIRGDNAFMPEHIETLADFCEAQNPRFDRGRWLNYIAGKCGANGGKRK
jgi:hypothetical protein